MYKIPMSTVDISSETLHARREWGEQENIMQREIGQKELRKSVITY